MSTNTRESDRSPNVAKQIAALRQIGVGGLRERYEEVFGEPTRAGNKDFLFKRIAWRIQSLAEGDLSERARRGPPAGNPVRRAGGRHHAQLLDWIRMRRDETCYSGTTSAGHSCPHAQFHTGLPSRCTVCWLSQSIFVSPE